MSLNAGRHIIIDIRGGTAFYNIIIMIRLYQTIPLSPVSAFHGIGSYQLLIFPYQYLCRDIPISQCIRGSRLMPVLAVGEPCFRQIADMPSFLISIQQRVFDSLFRRFRISCRMDPILQRFLRSQTRRRIDPNTMGDTVSDQIFTADINGIPLYSCRSAFIRQCLPRDSIPFRVPPICRCHHRFLPAVRFSVPIFYHRSVAEYASGQSIRCVFSRQTGNR